MKILLDLNIPQSWITILEKEGFKVKHWSNIGALTASDIEIMNILLQRKNKIHNHEKQSKANL